MVALPDIQWEEIQRTLIPGYDPYATAPDGYYFDEAVATKAVQFFARHLRHVKGKLAQQPFELQPHEMAITGAIVGWRRPDGTRRYREVLYFVPRKNNKSTWAAGMACLILFGDPEHGAENYSTAADRDQAALVFEIAKGMVLSDPVLSANSQVYETSKTIKHNGSFYRAISAEANTKHGYNTHFAVNDELHAHKNGELVDVIQTSTGARAQPLIIHITTSDYERPGSVCNEKHDYACKVRDGIIDDPSFLPIVFEASIDDDWTDPEVWAKANPMLGKSISFEYMERECKRAQESPAYENTFKRLHLNIRTEQDVRWLRMDKWDSCGDPFTDRSLHGQPCYAGVDLASTGDIAAVVLYFPEGSHVLPYFFCPEEKVADRGRHQVPYPQWEREGHIIATEGNVVDYDAIRVFINGLGERFDIREIAIDRWNSTQLQTQLSGDGFEVVQFGQGFASMSAPSKELEKLVTSAALQHGGNPVLRWMASNAAAEIDAAGNVKPSKKKSSEKIDGIVGLVMAIGRALVSDGSGTSTYEDHGLVFL